MAASPGSPPLTKFKLDTREIEDLARRSRASPQKVKKGILSGLNKIGDQGFTQVRKDIAKQTGIRVGDTRRSKGLFKKLATPGSEYFDVVARSKTTPLSYFNPSQRNLGVMASPWANRQFFRGAFTIRMKSGHLGVFTRSNRGESRRKMYRNEITGRMQGGQLPIREAWGPSLAKELVREPLPTKFKAKVTSIAPRVMNHEIQRVLTGLGRKRRGK